MLAPVFYPSVCCSDSWFVFGAAATHMSQQAETSTNTKGKHKRRVRKQQQLHSSGDREATTHIPVGLVSRTTKPSPHNLLLALSMHQKERAKKRICDNFPGKKQK
jgi:hypothetical protein